MAEQGPPEDWFEFMQKMWNPASFPLPGMITPTVNIEEIHRKIGELTAVENWLTINIGFVQLTIKTLQMQKTALESLRSPGEPAAKASPSGAPQPDTPRNGS